MGQQSGRLRVARRASWLLRFLRELQASRSHSPFPWSSSINRLLVRFPLPVGFLDSSVWFSWRIAIFRSRRNRGHIMDTVQPLTLPDAAGHPAIALVGCRKTCPLLAVALLRR